MPVCVTCFRYNSLNGATPICVGVFISYIPDGGRALKCGGQSPLRMRDDGRCERRSALVHACGPRSTLEFLRQPLSSLEDLKCSVQDGLHRGVSCICA
uniref:Uncharacterized protein n=1 Tax=Parascaris equorum TaxID=6256 RepID=A0A914RQB0_PAREQ